MPRLPLVLALLLSIVPLANAADIPISGVRVAPGHWIHTRHAPVVAAGDGFLVVWHERTYGHYLSLKVRAYDAEGRPFEAVAVSAGLSYTPKAVWTGEWYLLVSASHYPLRGPVYYPYPSVKVTRLRRDGTPVDGEPAGHLLAERPSSILSLAWNGSRALAVVDYTAPGPGGTRERHLLEMDRSGAFLSDTVVTEDIVAAAPDGDGFFLLRRDQGSDVAAGAGRFAAINGASVDILDRDGAVHQQVPIGHVMHSIAFDGSEWLTAYLDEEGRVCTASFTGPDDIRRSCRSTESAAFPFVAATGGRSFVAWEQRSDNQIMTDGGLASIELVGQGGAVSAVDATGLLVAWGEGGDVRIGGFAHDGAQREEHVIPDAWGPRLASTTDGSLVVFSHDDRVQAMRLDTSGAPLAPVIEVGPGSNPNVATNGDGWLVVHESNGRLRTTYVTRGGFVAGVQQRQGPLPQQRPVVAGIPGGYVVAWQEQQNSMESQSLRIVAQRLNGYGLPVSAEVTIGEGLYPGLGCSSQACLLTWRRANRSLVGVRLDHDLNRIGSEQTFGTFESWNLTQPTIVKADGDGFRVYRDPGFDLGGVETFLGRTVFAFTRDGRVYIRALASKVRGVRR